MEALSFAPPQPRLCRPKFSTPIKSPNNGVLRSTAATKIRPYIVAVLSKQTAEISPVPAVASREKPLQAAPLYRVSPDSLLYPAGFLGAVPEPPLADGDGIIDAMEYLTNILSSRVYDVAVESPLQFASKLSERLGVNMFLSRERIYNRSCPLIMYLNFKLAANRVFSFKLRGAYNMMAKLPKEQLEKGVICSSAGNHAQGVALAAQKLGCDAVIVMPVTTPEIKWKSVKRLGATVVLVGDSYDEAQAYAKKRGEEEGRTFVPPFDHPHVIMGQGTVGMEIVRQIQSPIHAIFVPVGGGGLIAGIAAYVKRVSPEQRFQFIVSKRAAGVGWMVGGAMGCVLMTCQVSTQAIGEPTMVKIIGVEPADANAMALSLHHGQRVMLDQVGGFADGVAVKVVGEETFRLCRELIDGVVLVSRDAICASIKDMFEEKRSILEPAGALALAGAEAYCKYYGLKDENIVAIASGANMNFDRLRLVTELADVGRKREAVLATFLPEEPGSFKQFCELVGPMNITEFKYRFNSDEEAARVFYSVGLHTDLELGAMVDRMESSQLRTLDLTDNNLVKDHLRYLMGGRSNVENELLCRFIFPERPGALMKFLDAFSPRWNISLFHYRAQGETGANVLVGIQVAQTEMDEFQSRANGLGYDYVVESDNEAFQLLMH
ncbi:L-O-methylthreonine resistant 1 [Actinidia rufa]|uniref:threonine ammonia-lyase n=1 Tax=Actinidia rufa TaxID=165716 RepID=A0A7J0FV60_9ERIC|nr:L-O-methylthreonine resistant 1 [Actinidia rufa]